MEQRAYHGTSLENANKICKSSNEINFKISCGKTEWLGNGVYFFDNKQNAIDWSKKVRQFEEIGIVSAMIKADEEKVFDLVGNPKQLKLFDKMCAIVANKYNKIQNEEIDKSFMSTTIELLKQQENFDVIRAFFEIKNTNFENINKAKQKFPIGIGRIQICVINTDCITDCKVEV